MNIKYYLAICQRQLNEEETKKICSRSGLEKLGSFFNKRYGKSNGRIKKKLYADTLDFSKAGSVVKGDVGKIIIGFYEISKRIFR